MNEYLSTVHGKMKVYEHQAAGDTTEHTKGYVDYPFAVMKHGRNPNTYYSIIHLPTGLYLGDSSERQYYTVSKALCSELAKIDGAELLKKDDMNSVVVYKIKELLTNFQEIPPEENTREILIKNNYIRVNDLQKVIKGLKGTVEINGFVLDISNLRKILTMYKDETIKLVYGKKEFCEREYPKNRVWYRDMVMKDYIGMDFGQTTVTWVSQEKNKNHTVLELV